MAMRSSRRQRTPTGGIPRYDGHVEPTDPDTHPSLEDHVRESLASVQILPEDQGTAALALLLAGLIDAATMASKYRRPMETIWASMGREPDEVDAYHKIQDALAAHSVASDLGPKLLAALAALGMTPASRTNIGKGGTNAVQHSPLDELRRARAKRDG